MPGMFDWVSAVGSIILIDLVLSGDNALVIGVAASSLPRKLRWNAIVVGGGVAILLRILFTVAATFLLNFPLLQAIGGIILLYIALHLLVERSHKRRGTPEQKEEKAVTSNGSFGKALLTIIVADATMSLDNILAIGAIANGELLPLIIGLIVSIVLILLGSTLIAELIERLPLLLDLACLILAWTAATMLLSDTQLGRILDNFAWTQIALPALALSITLAVDLYLWWYDTRKSSKNP
jgi:YjbE family integral membrane protein